jgi:putative endonuclease
MRYVYLLELSNGDIYVGWASDLKARLAQHRRGAAQSTKAYLPLKLRSYIAVETEETAVDLERYLKSGSGKAIARKRFLGATA